MSLLTSIAVKLSLFLSHICLLSISHRHRKSFLTAAAAVVAWMKQPLLPSELIPPFNTSGCRLLVGYEFEDPVLLLLYCCYCTATAITDGMYYQVGRHTQRTVCCCNTLGVTVSVD